MANLGGAWPAHKVAKGNVHNKAMKRCVCAFDDETFEEIRKRAIAQETSFAEQVRRLVEWGLEADAH